MHPLNCSLKQSGHFCPVLAVLSGLNFFSLLKEFLFFFNISIGDKIKFIFYAALTKKVEEKLHPNPMNYIILLIAKVFVFPSVRDKDSVLQNCWGKKNKNWVFFANVNVESISESADLDEIQLHFAL